MTTGGADLLLFLDRCGCCSWYDRVNEVRRAGSEDICRYYRRGIYEILDCELRGRPPVDRRVAKDQRDLSRFG